MSDSNVNYTYTLASNTILASGGVCAPISFTYDLVNLWREPWTYADNPFHRYTHDWDLLVAPRATRWLRRWAQRRQNVRDAWGVLRHGLREDDWYG